MSYQIKPYTKEALCEALSVWNEVVEEGNAFPQDEVLDEAGGEAFFTSQTYCGIAFEEESKKVDGLYILHPNNVGRCGHIANASYAVRRSRRGCGIGRIMVLHSLSAAQSCGFRILQFNAVVSSNTAALHLYASLGFTPLGTIPGGFLQKDGTYSDIIPHYRLL